MSLHIFVVVLRCPKGPVRVGHRRRLPMTPLRQRYQSPIVSKSSAVGRERALATKNHSQEHLRLRATAITGSRNVLPASFSQLLQRCAVTLLSLLTHPDTAEREFGAFQLVPDSSHLARSPCCPLQPREAPTYSQNEEEQANHLDRERNRSIREAASGEGGQSEFMG